MKNKKDTNKTKYNKLLDLIMDMKDKYGADFIIESFEKDILSSKNPKLSSWFVDNIENANIKDHEQVVIDSKNLKYNYLFAKNINGADVKAHAKIIIDSKDPEYNYKFIKNIKGADKDAHIEAILGSKKRKWIKLFLDKDNNFDSITPVIETKKLILSLKKD